MAEPLPAKDFSFLLAQAGISLPPTEVEDLRLAHAKLLGMLALIRQPAPPLPAEPAFTFSTGR